VSARARRSVGLFLLSLSVACVTTLRATKVPSSEARITQLRQAGAALGCHERTSEVFQVFFVCPGERQTLGIAKVEGKLNISCPDLRPRPCRKLFERLKRTTTKKPRAGQPESSEPVER
jgi:hypothetical protein